MLVIAADDTRRELIEQLGEAGFRVLEAVTSGEGIKLTLDSSPRLLIVAEEMPPLDGIELIPVIRRLSDSPIIVLGSGGEMAMVQALLQGADVYLARPVDLREFMARIRALLRRYSANRGISGEPLLHC